MCGMDIISISGIYLCIIITKIKIIIIIIKYLTYYASKCKIGKTSTTNASYLGTVHYLSGVRDQCSVRKTHGKSSCPVNKNFQKSWCPVSGRKEKSPCPVFTLYSHCVRGVICNDQQSLPLTAGVWGCCKPPPPAGPGQGPGRDPEDEAPGSSEAPSFYRIRKSLKLILYF